MPPITKQRMNKSKISSVALCVIADWSFWGVCGANESIKVVRACLFIYTIKKSHFLSFLWFTAFLLVMLTVHSYTHLLASEKVRSQCLMKIRPVVTNKQTNQWTDWKQNEASLVQEGRTTKNTMLKYIYLSKLYLGPSQMNTCGSHLSPKEIPLMRSETSRSK